MVQVTAANQFDHRQLWSLLQAGRQRSTRLRHVWVDAGYQDGLTGFVGALPLRLGSRGRDAAAPRALLAIIARRWVVERTFAWLGRFRRLSKDYEYLPQTAESMIYTVMTTVMRRRLVRMRS